MSRIVFYISSSNSICQKVVKLVIVLTVPNLKGWFNSSIFIIITNKVTELKFLILV